MSKMKTSWSWRVQSAYPTQCRRLKKVKGGRECCEVESSLVVSVEAGNALLEQAVHLRQLLRMRLAACRNCQRF